MSKRKFMPVLVYVSLFERFAKVRLKLQMQWVIFKIFYFLANDRAVGEKSNRVDETL